MNQMSTKPTATTHAATRKTRSIEFEKPTRNGSASRESIRCRADESCTMLAAPAGFRAIWFAGFARTAGSATAAWKEALGTIRRKAEAISPPTVENRIDRKIATPSVPPIWRKKVADAVATPMSRAGTAFCTATTRVCMHCPSPRPNTTIRTAISQYGVSKCSRKWKSTSPAVIRPSPTTGKTL